MSIEQEPCDDCFLMEICRNRNDQGRDDRRQRCDHCVNYQFIDSAYGYCRRLPPSQRTQVKWKWFFIPVRTYVHEFPLVAWCFSGCTQFKRRRK